MGNQLIVHCRESQSERPRQVDWGANLRTMDVQRTRRLRPSHRQLNEEMGDSLESPALVIAGPLPPGSGAPRGSEEWVVADGKSGGVYLSWFRSPWFRAPRSHVLPHGSPGHAPSVEVFSIEEEVVGCQDKVGQFNSYVLSCGYLWFSGYCRVLTYCSYPDIMMYGAVKSFNIYWC